MAVPFLRTSCALLSIPVAIGFWPSPDSSKAAGPFLIVCRLGQGRALPDHPVGNPIKHLTDIDLRLAEQREGFVAVAEQSVARFSTLERHRAAQSSGELL